MQDSEDKESRKSVVFSVSFTKADVKEVKDYLKKKKLETGMTMSRNLLIRKATLAKIRHEADSSKSFEEIFNSI